MDRTGEWVAPERPWRAVTAAIAGARAGTGRIVVVEGSAGSGKTHLLDRAAAEAAARGLAVVRARAGELDPRRLATELAEVAGPADGDGTSARLVLLDDLGSGDDDGDGDTGARAAALAARLAGAGRVAVVLATRPPTPGSGLARALAGLTRRAGAERLVLHPLSRTTTASLAAELL